MCGVNFVIGNAIHAFLSLSLRWLGFTDHLMCIKCLYYHLYIPQVALIHSTENKNPSVFIESVLADYLFYTEKKSRCQRKEIDRIQVLSQDT